MVVADGVVETVDSHHEKLMEVNHVLFIQERNIHGVNVARILLMPTTITITKADSTEVAEDSIVAAEDSVEVVVVVTTIINNNHIIMDIIIINNKLHKIHIRIFLPISQMQVIRQPVYHRHRLVVLVADTKAIIITITIIKDATIMVVVGDKQVLGIAITDTKTVSTTNTIISYRIQIQWA